MHTWALVAAWVGLPAVGYTLLLYVFDRHDREPLWAIGLALVGGAAAAAVAGNLELRADALLPYLDGLRAGDRDAAFRAAFLVVAPIEELSKLAVVALIARSRVFNEPVDGVVYAGTTALGFAALEGALAAGNTGEATLVMRAALAMPGHVCFSALWGAGLGSYHYWGRRAGGYALASLALAIVAHGLYDFLLMADGGAGRAGVVPLVAVVAMVAAVSFRSLLHVSPFRLVHTAHDECLRCARPSRGTRFCAGCGARLAIAEPAREPQAALMPTLAAFAVGSVVAIASASLLSDALGEPVFRLMALARQGHTNAAAVWVTTAAAAGLGAGLTTRRMGGVRPVVEALIATALACLCAALYVALAAPALLSVVLYLSPVVVLAAALAARAFATARP